MNTLLLVVLLLAPQEGVRYPAKPGPRDFILDEAKVLKGDDATEIRILCDEVLTKKKAPIIVVTIPSLATYGAAGWPIERYALNLMSEWGVGWPEWNYGMLLLVSIGDRKARIELGGSWERRKDDDAKRVMSDRIIPHFKKGDTSKGVLEGVRGLHDIALDAMPSRTEPRRGAPGPAPGSTPGPAHVPGVPSSGLGCLPVLLVIVVGGIILMFVFRMLRRGSVSSWGNNGPYGGGYYGGGGGGFGSSFGGGLLGGALGSMLGGAITRRYDSPSAPPPASYGGSDSSSSSSSDSSDYGGGSFGGGFSGGGGATGEW